ncbi:unnamed protein product [Arabidopsis thaliana]|uniref:(thale cress) hypothetical protein n=1 Tax=Arabidopsis thaliana TaxID=3702 RepID=A0A7G2E1X7_ARATH|nr:unnamed protein product [Arabidopsis thaliana]
MKVSPRLNSALLLLFMILATVMGPVTVEARTCETSSNLFNGPCLSSSNCANVCHNEGFSDGDCRGFRRRCFYGFRVATSSGWQVSRESRDLSYCVYDKDIATGLGVGSFLVLLASQLLIMVASRCLCCGRALTPSGSRSWAIVLFIITWVFFFIAQVCLLAGSVRNAYHTKYRVYFGNTSPSCRSLRKGVFGAGAAFIVLTGIVSELYYVTLSRAKDFQPSRDPGIRMSSL